MWRDSQMAKLSDALAAYLATDRHKTKVIVTARSISQLCQLLSDSVTQQKDLLTSNLHDLTERYEQQQEPLHRLELEAERISRRLRDQISDLGDMIEDKIEGQLRVYVNRLPEWGAEVDPENRLTMAPWKVREQAEAVAKEVAAQLGISTRTAESHKYEMMEGLGVQTTAELVQYAIKLGLNTP